MKKTVFALLALLSCCCTLSAQDAGSDLQRAVTALDQAKNARDYEALEQTFSNIAATQRNNWLPYYYAAYCDAKIGFLYQEDGEKIEPYSNRGEAWAQKAQSLLDTTQQKNELSELYTVMSMVYRTKVFINPMTYGRQFGPLSSRLLQKARQLNPQNPRALYVAAWEKYYTPKTWGGDKEQARQLASQSLQLLEKEAAGTQPHWGKAENTELLGKYK